MIKISNTEDALNSISIQEANTTENEAISNLLIQSFIESYQEKTPQFSMNKGREQEH